MAERNEAGIGRMAEPLEIVAAAENLLRAGGTLAGKRVVVTSGPTHEPIDPVRYIANRSSGKQGHAIAAAAAAAGADVTLVSGPVNVPDPPGVRMVKVESARDMLAAVEAALPADVAIFAAAVADWRVARSRRAEDQERQRRHAETVAGGEPGHPGDGRAAQGQAPATRDRVCRRDGECRSSRQGQAGAQGLRLDPGERRVARSPA